MKALGGYFELEIQRKKEYHVNALRLNTGRNAFEYIILAKKYNKVYIPYFTCDVLLEPLIRNKIEYQFYSIDENFEPVFDFLNIKNNEVFLYTNYFGLKDAFIKRLAVFCKNLIVDNAQSFFSLPEDGVDTFYSPRKFFGLPDGAYLYTNKNLEIDLEQDVSYKRFSHLLKRIDLSAEDGYEDFSFNDGSLNNNPIKKMSVITKKMLVSLNYNNIAETRKKNFRFINEVLSQQNRLEINVDLNAVPMVYPFFTKNAEDIRKRLVQNRVYTAKYWPNVPEWSDKKSLETKMYEDLIYLPIDQRYGKKDLLRIIKIIDI